MKLHAIVLALTLVGFVSAYPSWPENSRFGEYGDLQSEGDPPSTAPGAEVNSFDWAEERPYGGFQSAPQAEVNEFLETENVPFEFAGLQSNEEPFEFEAEAEAEAEAEEDGYYEPFVGLQSNEEPFEFEAEVEAKPPAYGYFQSNKATAPEVEMNAFPAAEMSNFPIDDELVFIQQETVPMPGGGEVEVQAEDLIRLQEYLDAHMRQPPARRPGMADLEDIQDDFEDDFA